MVYKGICTRYSAKKPGMNGRYAIGQKRYSQCQIFINWEGNTVLAVDMF
ncbi:MAG: hypothetical protein OEM77_02615 [Nitrosopumilus sp.]|nr:hypothetical protein [Nitrosopumilus sp.]MDH3736322.1 hypothetical protein [Nitrosopumilus sp.]MDH3833715.1 hypothetical protein [Nitrosopumilus sp.]